MRLICTEPDSGKLLLEEVPEPIPGPGMVRVITKSSVISSGTEKAVIELARSSLIAKARARPDLVKKVLDRARSGGWSQAFQAAQTRLSIPIPLGYSSAGMVDEVGPHVRGLAIGDRVAVAGAGYASHAEVNVAPEHLVARIESDLPFEEAAYATVAAIALQGLRVGGPAIGEIVAVVGLGLIGQITTQLLNAAGCRVVGVDPVAYRRKLAQKYGAEAVADPDTAEASIMHLSNGHGADSVYLTASADSNAPMESAGRLARKKGVVVVVGAVGMKVPRRSFYEKELDLRMSTSYGPGRYDAEYEEGGLDYPYPYVRWTEQRNLEASLTLMQSGKLDVRALTTHRYPFEDALDAYQMLREGREDALGIVLTYAPPTARATRVVHRIPAPSETGRLGVGVIGAGSYARQFLLPELRRHKGVWLTNVAAAHGGSAAAAARRFGFAGSTTDATVLFDDPETRLLVIATRHDTHADLVRRGLDAGKHVFVEKPLVVSEPELEVVRQGYDRANSGRSVGLLVGLNRRFSPMVLRIKEALGGAGPLHMVYSVNSGSLPPDAWPLQPEQGGGMLVSEACHFIDVMLFLCGARPVRVFAQSESGTGRENNFSAVIRFSDGSVGTLIYATRGDAAAGKESLRVMGRGLTADLQDFRRLHLARSGRRRVFRALNQDKGQRAQITALLDSIQRTGQGPIPIQELFDGMRAVFAIRTSLETGRPVSPGLESEPEAGV